MGKCVTCVTTNLIDDVRSWGVFASVFSRLSKNRLNPKRAPFLVPCLAIFERSIVCFYRDILEKMKLILAFCSICERENFWKALFPFAFFLSMVLLGLTFNWSKLRISVDFSCGFDIFQIILTVFPLEFSNSSSPQI